MSRPIYLRFAVWLPLAAVWLPLGWGCLPTSAQAQNTIYSNSAPVWTTPSISQPIVTGPPISGPTISGQIVSGPIVSYPVQFWGSSSTPAETVVVTSPTRLPQPVQTQTRQTHSFQSSTQKPLSTSSASPAPSSNTHIVSTLPIPRLQRETKNNRDGVAQAQLVSSTFNRNLPPLPHEPRFQSPYNIRSIEAARNQSNRYRAMAANLPPSVADLADGNAGFAERWANLAETLEALTNRVADAKHHLDSTTRDYNDVSRKIEDYGLTPTIGILLRNKRDQLDQWQADDSQALFSSQELGRSRQEQLELQMVHFDGSDVQSQTREILRSTNVDIDGYSDRNIVAATTDLLRDRRAWLDSLRQGYQDYQQKLGELDSATTASAKLSQDYRKLIDRHVTWIRSGEPVAMSDFNRLKEGMSALFSTRRSGEFGLALENKWRASPASGIGLIISLALIWVARWRAKTALIKIGERKRMREATADSRKVASGFLTVLVAIGIPSMLYLIGRWLAGGVVTESTLYSSAGCVAASLVALMVEAPRQVLRKFGYVDQHVDVELPRRDRATAYLTLIGFGLVLAAYVVTLAGAFDHGVWRDSLARFGFIVAMLLVTWTAHLTLRPTGGFLEPLIEKFGGSVIHRVRWILYVAGIGFPIAMIAASALGYQFTANELIQRVIWTLAGFTIASTLWGSIKILASQAWQLLAGNSTATVATERPRNFDRYGDIGNTSTTATSEVTGVLGEHYLELKHHLAFLCQVGLVLSVIIGLGWLWRDVFPDIGIGNPVVWTVDDTVRESIVNAGGQRTIASVVETKDVTALHLIMAATTLFVAFQIAKLLPALFDALVLQRVSFDEGMEHFSLVLGRFLLFGIGCFIAARLIGIRWQAIQWLAVGLTIGLGFGLQDMVRNLFGGLIVLFEKPARLGDCITVGNITGRVSAQRLRTTVLSDDEGREVIVPNKNFVNEDVVNWMGAGRISVVPLEVATTRDERPADLCRRLQELVIAQEHVLLTPAPQATLVCVAKRTQRIEIRAWIEDGHTALDFRDSLLKTVRRFLRDEQLLASPQPEQPEMRNVMDDDHRPPRRRSSNSSERPRRRSA